MATYTVSDDALTSAQAEAYFSRADHRALMGLRATVEILGIPVPDYAVRRKPGRTPAKDVMKAYRADNPAPRSHTLAPRKPNADPAQIAARKAPVGTNPVSATGVPNLFDQAFAG
jgi:hypothetical protein